MAVTISDSTEYKRMSKNYPDRRICASLNLGYSSRLLVHNNSYAQRPRWSLIAESHPRYLEDLLEGLFGAA
jgi:hypothetical protein